MAFDLGIVRGVLELKDSFVAVLSNAETKLTGFGDRLESELKRTKSFSAGLDAVGSAATTSGAMLTVGLTAPIGLVGGLVAKLGIDAVESRNLMEKSFGDMITDADSWASALSRDLGLNRFEMEKTAGTMFNMVSSMGLGKKAAFDVSTGIVKLAADMASFRNISIDEALQKLQSGLTGETEPLKRIGILVDDNTIKQYAYKNGIAETGAELSQQQKVLARYGAILQQTANDQGDLAKTLDSPANKLRIMQSRITEAATALGVSLVPMMSDAIDVASKIVPVIQSAVEWFSKLPAPIKDGAVGLALLAAAAGPVLFVAGTLAQSLAAIIPLMNAAGVTSLTLGKALTFMGQASAVVAVAFASWEVGKWLGEWSGLTDWVERTTGHLMGLTDAQIEAGMAARKAAESQDEHKTSTKGAADSAAELAATLQAEIEAQQGAAGATKEAADAMKEAKKEAKEHAEALEKVNEKIAMATGQMNNFTDEQEQLIASYDKLGLSAGEIATKMELSEEAIGHFLSTTQKSITQTAALWREHWANAGDDAAISMDRQRNAVKLWFDDEVAKLDTSDKNFKEHYDALAAVAQDSLDKIGSEWDDLKEKSIESLRAQAEAARDDYNKMLNSGLHFTREVLDEQLEKTRALERAATGFGDAAEIAFKKAQAAAKEHTDELKRMQEEADKARKANQAIGGSFEVTRENFEPTARGLGATPGLVEFFLKKGYSFEQALLWSKHPDWPPPEHPGPRVPGFEKGVKSFEGGWAFVGEGGPELAKFPPGTDIYPNGQFPAGMGGGAPVTHNWYVNGSAVDVAKQIKNILMRDLKNMKLFPSA